MTRKELRGKVLRLPHDERVRLVRDLISSLDGPQDRGAAKAWVDEIERRLKEIRNGGARLEDWKDVRKRIRASLAAKK